MLLKFIDKVENHYFELSTFINCSPDRILFYYYNSYIYISLSVYEQMKEWAQNGDSPQSCLNQWIDLIENDLQAKDDLEMLKKAEYIDQTGPYYYLPTNTRFFLRRIDMNGKESLSSVDFALLFNLHKAIEADKELQKYFKSRKNNKKTTPSIEALVKDIQMCIEALNQVSRINRHCQYQQALIEERRQILENKALYPAAPSNPPEKPSKPDEPELSFNSIRALSISRAKQKEYEKQCSQFGHELKKYLIHYREFEKACERYKEASLAWSQFHEALLARCNSEIDEAHEKIDAASALLEIYHYILLKSFVHPDYHDTQMLCTFQRYLQTGRANDLQDCMNLYEEEQHWTEIKESQERIENTIYFLQGEGDFEGLNEKLSKKLTAATNDA